MKFSIFRLGGGLDLNPEKLSILFRHDVIPMPEVLHRHKDAVAVAKQRACNPGHTNGSNLPVIKFHFGVDHHAYALYFLRMKAILFLMAVLVAPVWAGDKEELANFIGAVYGGRGTWVMTSGENALSSYGCIRRVGENYFTPDGYYRKVGNTYLRDGDAVVTTGKTYLGGSDAVVKTGSTYLSNNRVRVSTGNTVIDSDGSE